MPKATNQQSPKPHWINVALSLLAAALTVLGIWMNHKSSRQNAAVPTASQTPVMKIDRIDQKAPNGAAVAGVQGNVTVNKEKSTSESR